MLAERRINPTPQEVGNIELLYVLAVQAIVGQVENNPIYAPAACGGEDDCIVGNDMVDVMVQPRAKVRYLNIL